MTIRAYHRPASLPELLDLLASGTAMPAGGATDILPHAHDGLLQKSILVSTDIPELCYIRIDAEYIRLGAAVRLIDLIQHEELAQQFPVIRKGLSQIGGPQHRRAGTLAGNLCLDTRCNWFNQSRNWRHALGYCKKSGSQVCHVVRGSERCHAVFSSDGAAIFIALGAELLISSLHGERRLPLDQLYKANGLNHLNLAPTELITEIVIPKPRQGQQSDYQKLRLRNAVDFPLLGIAGSLICKKDHIQTLRLSLTAVESWPLLLDESSLKLKDARIAQVDCDAIIKSCLQQSKPLGNAFASAAWRKKMIPVYLRRVLHNLGFKQADE